MNWAGKTSEPAIPASTQGFVSHASLIEDVRARLAARTGFSVATLNLDHAVKLRTSPEFRAAYRAHTHVTADGRPVVWMERLAGTRVELVPGSDLVVPLARVAAETGANVALVGSSDAVLNTARERLETEVPGLTVARCVAPSLGFDPGGQEAAGIAQALATDTRLGLVFLALGAPKQELFAARLAETAPHLGIVSVGAGLDFIAGTQQRAPFWMRQLALEWLWRLVRQPRRLGSRYARCAALLPVLSVQAIGARLHWGQRART